MERYFEFIKDEVDSVQSDLGYVVKAVKELAVAAGVEGQVSTQAPDFKKKITREYSPAWYAAKRAESPTIKPQEVKLGYLSDVSVNIGKLYRLLRINSCFERNY